ncbi:MAG: ABC-2 type transport system ATP-binding protein [Zhongshania sp.]|jgi:ABC-2 type transport system ATP-binding protein
MVLRGSLATLLVVALTACGGSNSPRTGNSTTPESNPVMIAASAQDVFIESPVADNASGATTTAIAATVFIPEHADGATYPLILHSHGWGGDRVTEADTQAPFDSSKFYSVAIDAEVKRFWQEGYAVISFDERGFHDSSGAIRVMDPEFETRDAIAVLDWAESNLSLSRSLDNNPLVGAIGGSYGGGFQLALAAFDDRLDAITPSVTWYDLPESLVPNGVIKKLWVFGLCFSAVSAGDRTFSDELNQACQQAGIDSSTRFAEDLDPALLQFLGAHGMAAFEARHKDASDAFWVRGVDALLTQGQRDLLFPLNNAMENYRFLSSLGGDVRLITHQHGHYIGPPLDVQAPLGATRCGSVDTLEAKHAWFAEKLKGEAGAAALIPTICIGLDDNNGAALTSAAVAAATYRVTVPATSINSIQNNYGGDAPTFILLAAPISETNLVLAGIPVANVTVTPNVPMTKVAAFVGIGVLSLGDSSARLIDDQVAPLRNGDHVDKQLIGVGEVLKAGDQIGVLIYGDYDAFNNVAHTAWQTNLYSISGSIDLPIVVVP